MRPRYLLACALLISLTSSAQIELVKDFGTTGTDPFPQELTASGDLLFFIGFDAATGYEPWVSDGTEAGTVMVKDINPGPASSLFQPWFTDVDGVLFFGANDGTNGTELWKSDGTEAGTVMVKNISPGANPSNPSFMIHYGNDLLFGAIEGVNSGLWKSDGTDAGTQLVYPDFQPYVSIPVEMNGHVYFNAYTPLTGNYTLWATDGTAAGTTLIRNPATGGPTNVYNLVAADNLLYFGGVHSEDGTELWYSDGTAIGTERLDILSGSYGSIPTNIVTKGDTAFFCANDGVFGNRPFVFRPGQAPVPLYDVHPLMGNGMLEGFAALMSDQFYFIADDLTLGTGLWKSDGTPGETAPVAPGSDIVLGSLSQLAVVGDSMYFSAFTPATGFELWMSDGTEAGMVMIQDRNPGIPSFLPMELTLVGSTLYMRGTANGSPNQLYKLHLDWTTSIPEAIMPQRIQVWPNPTDGLVTLSGLLTNDRLRMFDMLGQEVVAPTHGTATSLDLSSLLPGAYMIHVAHADGTSCSMPVIVDRP